MSEQGKQSKGSELVASKCDIESQNIKKFQVTSINSQNSE